MQVSAIVKGAVLRNVVFVAPRQRSKHFATFETEIENRKYTQTRLMQKERLTKSEEERLINLLRERFEGNKHRHPDMEWKPVAERLQADAHKLWTLYRMEETGGEPDVIAHDPIRGAYCFCDCARESPKGRRSLCYDAAAWRSRKEHKPVSSAEEVAKEMGIDLLTEEEYILLQSVESVDAKSSSWIRTPEAMRSLGGALFGDCRYGRVFFYHNGAESYYSSRGFRGLIWV